jgi:stage II sporulation protein D
VNVYGDTVITTVLKREYYTLKASAPGNIVIAGKGWGHGLGMSQYGARDLAVFGAEYDQIIHAYYADVEIISLK